MNSLDKINYTDLKVIIKLKKCFDFLTMAWSKDLVYSLERIKHNLRWQNLKYFGKFWGDFLWCNRCHGVSDFSF